MHKKTETKKQVNIVLIVKNHVFTFLKLTLLFGLYDETVKHFAVMSCPDVTPSLVSTCSEQHTQLLSPSMQRWASLQLALCQEQLRISLSLAVSTTIFHFGANALMGTPGQVRCVASRAALPDIQDPKGFSFSLSPFQQH